MNVVQFRPYKVRPTVDSGFVNVTTTFNKEFAAKDLEKSGLTLNDMLGYAIDNLQLPQGATAGYYIPYFGLDGEVLRDAQNYNTMYRIRLEYPPYIKAQRYTQPSSEDLLSQGLPRFFPYLYPCQDLEGETIYCCEGEKKTASFVKHLRLPAFGIGGCNMWMHPAGVGGVHPWILDYIRSRNFKRVVIVPDGDIFRYDICRAYGTFATELSASGLQVELLNPPGKIDDLIYTWKERALDELQVLPKLNPDQLIQTPAQLATKYGLSFRQTEGGKAVVHQNTSNIMILLENHPAFPKIWRNLDTNRVFVGDKQATPELSDMDIANHMQHNFGLEKVTSGVVNQCITALAKRNQRSPFLEDVANTVWDKVPRLDTWLHDYWGIDNTPFTREVSAKWLMSACARLDKPGSKVDWMMIVIGPQGTGKTSMPNLMFKGNSTVMYGESTDKDLHMKLHSALCVGFDELDSFTKRDASMLKAMITCTEDMFRPPYGSSIEVFPRRFTLYGCGNFHEFLQSDPSGQRRYAIVECNRLLDFKGLELVRDQIWAEAWWRYKQGNVQWWEVRGATENARRYETPNILAERIQARLETHLRVKYGEKSSADFKFTMSELFAIMDMPMPANGSGIIKDTSRALKDLGYARKCVRTAGIAGWYYQKG